MGRAEYKENLDGITGMEIDMPIKKKTTFIQGKVLCTYNYSTEDDAG